MRLNSPHDTTRESAIRNLGLYEVPYCFGAAVAKDQFVRQRIALLRPGHRLDEWPFLMLRGFIGFFAHDALFALRARAAKKSNDRVGLEPDI